MRLQAVAETNIYIYIYIVGRFFTAEARFVHCRSSLPTADSPFDARPTSQAAKSLEHHLPQPTMSCAAPKSPLLNSVTGTWMVGRVRGLRAAPTSRPFRVCQLGGVVSRLGAAESVDHNPVGTGAATAVAAAAAFCLISTPSAALAEPMFSGGSVFSQHQQQHLKAAATTGLRLDRKADRPPAWASSQVGQAAVHFMTGGVGGCIGAAAVFPIDLVKTRYGSLPPSLGPFSSQTHRATPVCSLGCPLVRQPS